jgi:hypothetical protein
MKLASESKYDQITLEDVETAISILEHFYNKMRRAEMVLQRFKTMQGRTGGGAYGMTFQDIISMATEMQKQKEGKAKEEIPVGELTPEEISEMKSLVKKIKEQKT